MAMTKYKALLIGLTATKLEVAIIIERTYITIILYHNSTTRTMKTTVVILMPFI
jgi:hypothetical protein